MSDGSAPQVEQGSVQPQAAPTDPAPVAPIDPAPAAPAPAPAVPPIAAAPTPPIDRITITPKPAPPSTGGWWTLPIMCVGISLIACAIIIGQVEENRQLSWQKNKLQMDLDYLQKQAAVNDEFLSKLSTDANLVERLAQRQMKLIRQGSAVLDLKGAAGEDNTSAFKLVRIPPPPEVKPYEPAPGLLTHLFGTDRQRLYAMGLGAFLVAVGLIMGGSEPKR